MNALDTIKNTIQMADMVCGSYLKDMNDQDFMKRPHAGCNHVNWQVGHLISSDNSMFTGMFGEDSMPALPEGFKEKYAKENKDSDDPAAFCDKAELMKIHEGQRAAVMAKLDTLSESDLDGASPEPFQSFAPNVGAVLNMLGSHWMMHAGQWVIVRRELGKDIVI